MIKTLKVRPIGWVARIADVLMVPIMYLLSGTFRERPQKTHAWNVQNLTKYEASLLDQHKMVYCEGVQKAIARSHWWSFWFHVPIFGGWRNYVVLDTGFTGKWHVGWRVSDMGVQISKVALVGPVRMLLGSGAVLFFGVTDDGFQLPIHRVGEGRIGDRGPHSKIQLC
jgi:hypothetical protein